MKKLTRLSVISCSDYMNPFILLEQNVVMVRGIFCFTAGLKHRKRWLILQSHCQLASAVSIMSTTGGSGLIPLLTHNKDCTSSSACHHKSTCGSRIRMQASIRQASIRSKQCPRSAELQCWSVPVPRGALTHFLCGVTGFKGRCHLEMFLSAKNVEANVIFICFNTILYGRVFGPLVGFSCCQFPL